MSISMMIKCRKFELCFVIVSKNLIDLSGKDEVMKLHFFLFFFFFFKNLGLFSLDIKKYSL